MKHTSPEEFRKRYDNRYRALNVAALEARRVLDGVQRGEIQLEQNVYEYALRRMVGGDIKFEKLTEAEMEALTREGYGEPSFTRPT